MGIQPELAGVLRVCLCGLGYGSGFRMISVTGASDLGHKRSLKAPIANLTESERYGGAATHAYTYMDGYIYIYIHTVFKF